jgi:DNA-binding CsgD family transcriptional regulator
METITAIGRQDEIGEIFRLVREAATLQGAVGHSYHFTPVFHSQTSPDTIVEVEGFTPQIIALYQDQAFRATDPTPDYIMQRGEPLLWTTAIRDLLAKDSSKSARKFYAIMESHALLHGLAIPLYGPHNRNAFAYFGFGEPLTEIEDERCLALQALMQAAHLRICLLLDRQASPITLSRREKEVLHWIARGKSNTDIAAILKISPDTVATYVRRLFDKLDSRDRVGATIKALQLGLIRL